MNEAETVSVLTVQLSVLNVDGVHRPDHLGVMTDFVALFDDGFFMRDRHIESSIARVNQLAYPVFQIFRGNIYRPVIAVKTIFFDPVIMDQR